MRRIWSTLVVIVSLLQATAGIGQAAPPALTQEELSALTVPSAVELANGLRAASGPADALPYAEWAVKSDPENEEAWSVLGRVLFDLGRLDDALVAADKALAINGDCQSALEVRSQVCLSTNRHAEALATAQRLIATAPNEAFGYYCRGTAYHELGHAALAAADFRRVAELEPDNPVALHNLGVTLFDAGKYEESLAAVSRSLEIAPNRVNTMTERAQTLLALGRPDEAVEQYEAVVAADAETAREYGTDELHALYEAKRNETATDDASAEESPELKVAREYTERAAAANEAGKYLEARGLISKALEVHCDFAPAHFVLGLIKAAEEDFTGAAVDFEYAMDLERENDTYAGIAGLANLFAGLHEDALKCLDRAIQLDPGCVAHRETRAQVYCQLDRYNELLEDCSAAIAVDPKNASMQNCCAWALLQLGNPNIALKHATISLDIRPGDADALHTRGEIYRALGNYDLAVKDFEAALEIAPDFELASESLEAVREEQGAMDRN
jgi:tetratricopeptide (TPR) repeat protein